MARFELDTSPPDEGAFGWVIRGKDTELDRDVAVKVLKAGDNAGAQERFAREARFLAKMSHPNIPAIYDIEFRDDLALIIFQFIDGLSLKDLLARDGRLSLATAVSWFEQIGAALDHAHGLEVIHRDVKPANIVVTSDGMSAYLVYFGIALTPDDNPLTGSGYVIGTEAYMSPEQRAGENLDARTDIYSLGLVLYEALAGTPATPGEYRSLSETDSSIPPEVDALIQDCLARERESRPQSAKAFVLRLRGIIDNPKPLAEVLTHGRLHEIQAALTPLRPAQFAALPLGQQALVFSKVTDLTGSSDLSLQYAAERFLDLLLTRALRCDPEDYQSVARPAVEWAFERIFHTFDGGDYLGRNSLRQTLPQAATIAEGEAFDILSGEIIALINRVDLPSKDPWYLHSLREVLEALLANPACGRDAARELKAHLNTVNSTQREARSDTHFVVGRR